MHQAVSRRGKSVYVIVISAGEAAIYYCRITIAYCFTAGLSQVVNAKQSAGNMAVFYSVIIAVVPKQSDDVILAIGTYCHFNAAIIDDIRIIKVSSYCRRIYGISRCSRGSIFHSHVLDNYVFALVEKNDRASGTGKGRIYSCTAYP